MKRIWIFIIAAMLFSSCSNLFHHENDPVVIPPEEPDLTVDHVLPGDRAIGIARNTCVLVFFSCELNEATISNETVIVEKIDITETNGQENIIRTTVDGELNVINNKTGVVSFKLSESNTFEAQRKYGITIKKGVRGSEERVLQDDFESTFTTGGTVDNTPPELEYVSPDYLVDKDNKPITSLNIIIHFNETIDSTNLSNTRLIMRDLKTNDEFNCVIFTKLDILNLSSILEMADFNFPLIADGHYQIELFPPSDIRDLAGNAFTGVVKQNVDYLRSYSHPSLTDCFSLEEGAECLP